MLVQGPQPYEEVPVERDAEAGFGPLERITAEIPPALQVYCALRNGHDIRICLHTSRERDVVCGGRANEHHRRQQRRERCTQRSNVTEVGEVQQSRYTTLAQFPGVTANYVVHHRC